MKHRVIVAAALAAGVVLAAAGWMVHAYRETARQLSGYDGVRLGALRPLYGKV